ncbi:MAG: sulfatase [Pirellulaceae bacterium]|nr:MAG: sulfatase [Pirellulaceae bacterium]
MYDKVVPGCDRRTWLKAAGCGFGYLALAGLMGQTARAQRPLAPGTPHHPPRARRVIFLFMQGGPSHVDTFDYKPLLAEQDGRMLPFDDARVLANTGMRGSTQRVMNSPWKFRQYGESGRWVSELFPNLAQCVDDLCFLHAMHTEGVAHGPATLFLHCGATSFIRPSIGSWVLYGLGSENENLPGFVSIGPSAGNGGPRNYGSAFLPPVCQGTAIGKAGEPLGTIRNLSNPFLDAAAEREQLDLLASLNHRQRRQRQETPELEAVIESFELAWRMQMHAPEVLDIERESPATLREYGVGESPTDDFARKCLLARRLVEAGVRYVQVTYGDSTANPAWDQHSNLPKHADHARAVDKPIAALLRDLKQRGLLEDTLVWWGGEFGRTPYAEKNGTGRDHNPVGFTMWLAGAGVKPGFAWGATDEFGHKAIEGRVHMHDLHATILHLLGLDHERLTYRYAGREFRLTDVHGRVVHEILV